MVSNFRLRMIAGPIRNIVRPPRLYQADTDFECRRVDRVNCRRKALTERICALEGDKQTAIKSGQSLKRLDLGELTYMGLGRVSRQIRI